MKKTLKIVAILIMMAAAMLALTGCKNKKEEAKDPIVGVWKYENGGYTYTFKEDGTGDYSLGSTKMEFTYKTEGDKLSITYKGSTAPFETKFEIKDNKLNVKDSANKDTIYIKQ